MRHAPEGMVDVMSSKWRAESCSKKVLFGVTGKKSVEYCAQHAPDGMVVVMSRNQFRIEGSGKQPSFKDAGTKTMEYCSQHAPDMMVDPCSTKCRTGECNKQPSFRVANTITAEYAAQHARPKYGVEGFREGEVGPQYSGKETEENVILNDFKHISFHPHPTNTRSPSGGSRGSR